jgi:hypothetical protein
MFTNHKLSKSLEFRIYGKLLKLISKKTKWEKKFEQIFHQRKHTYIRTPL